MTTVPPSGMASSWRRSSSVCGPACQACGIISARRLVVAGKRVEAEHRCPGPARGGRRQAGVPSSSTSRRRSASTATAGLDHVDAVPAQVRRSRSAAARCRAGRRSPRCSSGRPCRSARGSTSVTVEHRRAAVRGRRSRRQSRRRPRPRGRARRRARAGPAPRAPSSAKAPGKGPSARARPRSSTLPEPGGDLRRSPGRRSPGRSGP